MIAAFLKSSGIDQMAAHSTVIIAIAMATFCLTFGVLADWASRESGFGVLGNAMILFISMLSGLILFNAKVMPLKYTLPPVLAMVAIGSAVLGLTVLSFIASRPIRT